MHSPSGASQVSPRVVAAPSTATQNGSARRMPELNNECTASQVSIISQQPRSARPSEWRNERGDRGIGELKGENGGMLSLISSEISSDVDLRSCAFRYRGAPIG